MAGIIISIGESGDDVFEQSIAEFQALKGLVVSHQASSNAVRLAKFSNAAQADGNLLSADKQLYLVVGTMIYRNAIGKKALSRLDQDLKAESIHNLTRHMDGPFCLLIWDREKDDVTIVTDHAGILNIYSYVSEKCVYLSSSSMTLSRKLPVSTNAESIVQFLRNASICDSDTIYNEIHLLEPATIYHYALKDAPRATQSRYWRSPTQIDETLSYAQAKEKLKSALFDSLNWIQDERVVCDVTAGYDSRTIITNLLKHGKEKKLSLEGFVFGPPASKEVKVVQTYRNAMDMPIHHVTLPADWSRVYPEYIEKSLNLTDGEESAFYYAPILFAYQYKQRQYDIALNGLGGELYRDFWWIQEMLFGKRRANYQKLVNNRVLQYEYDDSIYAGPWKKRLSDIAGTYVRKYVRTNSDMNPEDSHNTLQIDNIYFRQKIRRWAGRTISSSNQMIRALAPLTFKKNLEIGMRIPPKFKLFGRIIRDVISEIDPSIAGLPMLNGTPCVPLRFNNLAKFAPMVREYQKKVARKISQKYFGKTIWVDQTISYDPTEWIHRLLETPFMRQCLNFDAMVTATLYDKMAFKNFIEAAKRPGFPFLSQLGTMATLEMRMRNDNLKGF